MNTGWDQRLEILRNVTKRCLIDLLHMHRWTTKIEQEVEKGEYIIVNAERGGVNHVVAVIYSSATDNAVYKELDSKVEHIFVNGELDRIDSFAYGIRTPVKNIDDFRTVLVDWNGADAIGKIASNLIDVPIIARPPSHRTLLSEEPIDAVWLRLRQLTSVKLARNLVATRLDIAKGPLDEVLVNTKAEGLAFSLRNASDYFKTRENQNVSQRVLNLYYGSMALVFAEMLAAPEGPRGLGDIEKFTTLGHGLCTLDGENEGMENIVVSTVATGFFASWMKFLGVQTQQFPRQKPKLFAELLSLQRSNWQTIEELFARIPEIADLFLDIFSSKPLWLIPTYDVEANHSSALSSRNPKNRPSTIYSIFIDQSARLSVHDVACYPGPISQITEIASNDPGRHGTDRVHG